MVKVSAVYEGQLSCKSTHGPSGTILNTNAPVDNGGKGESFSPTDLVANALGTCMLTTMAIVGERKGIDLKGMKVDVIKEMVTTGERKIGKLTTLIEVPLAEDHPERVILERAALTCPVHRSLHPDVEKPLEFRWVGSKA
jgi:uncharacterized OsmC-like protein